MFSKSAEAVIAVRRMDCTNDKCPKKTFMEPLNFARPYARRTDDVASRIREESLSQPSRLASETLARQHIKVSPSTCLRNARALGKENPGDITCSGYVAIDDLAYRKGRKYMCAIADHYTRKVLAVFGSRYGPEIGEWLRMRPEIRLVSRDGSGTYASIIKEALPDADQVSDHFHLDKCLGDNMVEVVKKMICQTKDTLPYPYPSEDEARSYIMEEIYGMGYSGHRKRVSDYFAARHMQEEGIPLKDIAEKLSIKPQLVYSLLNTGIKKILSDDQLKILRQTSELARIISSGSITPSTIEKKMEGKLCLRLICRATRRLRGRYRMLREQVRAHNKNPKNAKGTKVTIEAIRKYIMTGITTSERLLRLKQTQPNIDRILQACISFRRMVAGRMDEPDIDAWLKLANDCHCPRLTSFAEYIRGDKEAVKNTYLTNYSNGIMEGTVNKIKAIKRSMFNRASVELLRAKAIYGGYHPLN
jgi:transposase